MSVEQTIIEKLTAEFAPTVLQVENESHKHSSGRGTESHFKITLVTPKFDGVRTLARHRAIYALLAHELETGVHALALHTYTDAEWQDAGQVAPKSPNCLGHGQ